MGIDSKARYAASHEYARQDGDEVVIGISDHAQAELGDIVFVELPAVGKTIAQGQAFGVVESVKAASDLYMPLGGTIVAANASLEGDPALVNRDCYGDGWMIRIKAQDPTQYGSLLDGAAYGATIGE